MISDPSEAGRGSVAGTAAPAFSLYVHIPYCDSKCPYCDFNSHAARVWPEQRYVAALLREMEIAAADRSWRGGRLRSVFLGGGTPSLFEPASIGAILNGARRLWHLDGDAEVTMEANPGTVDAAKLAGFAAAGINRLSFGVQSFQQKFLDLLGRIHDGAAAVRAVADARAANLENVNVDLMFAVPGQTAGEWESDLRTAIDLGTTHVSAYNLTFEEGTAFHALRRRGELRPLDESTEIAMYEASERIFAAAGFERYEISNYARPGRACRHNLQYWRWQPYLGVGAGAHSFAISPARRWSNERGPEAYMTTIESCGRAVSGFETLSEQQQRGEYVFLGLRCLDGIAAADFERRFGVAFADAFPHCAALRDDGLLEQSTDRWRLTPRGRLVSDEIFATFV
jgi:oxygen-independent coproporphyrinogen-3 oxidase